MKKYNLKNITIYEKELQRVFIYPIYPRDSKKNSDIGVVNTDSGSMAGTH